MQFAYPQASKYLLLALAVVLLAALGLLRKRQALRRLARQGIHQPGMLVRPGRQVFKCLLLWLVASLLGIAILGPQWGWTEDELPPRSGRDVLILLDVSRSMLAEDVAPNRLERAKADLHDLASQLERTGGYRIGLITFAERATVMCPLTSEYRCFVEELANASLDSLRIRGRASWGDGTQIRLALERAGQTIDEANAQYTDVVLVSDGEDMARETLTVADSLGRLGIAVHTFGLGDPSHDSLIPVQDNLGRPASLRYRGELVRTHLQEEVLRALAQKTQGRYFHASTSYRDFDRQFSEMLTAKQSQQRRSIHRERRGIHRYAWFVTPALLLLLFHSFLSDARRAGQSVEDQPNYFSWVGRNGNHRVTENTEKKMKRQNQSRATLFSVFFLCIFLCVLCDSVVSSSAPEDLRAAFRNGNELMRQAQQAGTNADSTTLLQAQSQYQACLSSQPSTPETAALLENARHNLEMTKLLLMQLGQSSDNPGQPDSSSPHPQSQSQKDGEAGSKDQSSPKPNQQQQQNAVKPESCTNCVTGQNRSASGRKMTEGGKGQGPGKGETPAPGSGSDPLPGAEPSRESGDTTGKDQESTPGRGSESDAKELFREQKPEPKKTESRRSSEPGGEAGKEGMGQLFDPVAQAATLRLQQSIQRIEKRRARIGNSPESSPEDLANQHRYRDW